MYWASSLSFEEWDKLRGVVNYGALICHSKPNSLLSWTDEMVYSLRGGTVFSKVDFEIRFHQTKVGNDEKKSASISKSMGNMNIWPRKWGCEFSCNVTSPYD